MYEHLAKLDEHLFRERGIHITTLRHPKGFEYLMFDEPKQKPRSLENRAKLGIPPYGNGWPGIREMCIRDRPYGLTPEEAAVQFFEYCADPKTQVHAIELLKIWKEEQELLERNGANAK